MPDSSSSALKPANTSWFGVVKQAGADWAEDKSTKLAAALAFYTMLSIGPLLLFAMKIVGKVFDDQAARDQIKTYVLTNVGQKGWEAVEPMLQKLGDEAVNHFSNGWAWLVLDRDQLKITSLHDADTPLVHEGMVPLFTMDVWEHAYYIDYRNERPRFVTSVLSNIVNWDFVAQNLDGQGSARADQEGASASADATT